MASKTTTYVVRIDNADGFDARATDSMPYTHAVVAGEKGKEAAQSWHSSAELARKAAEKFTTGRVVEAEAHNGSKVTITKRLRAEGFQGPAPKAPAKAKAAPAKAEEKGSELDPKTMAGYRVHTKSRSTKTVAVLVDGEAAGLDTAGGRWQTICLGHDFIVAHSGQRVARDVLGHPEVWCEPCRKAFKAKG